MRVLFAIALLLAVSAVSAKKSRNPCIPDPCYHNGRCLLAPFEELGFACQCPECFSGPTCAENICAVYDQRYAEPKPVSRLSMSVRISGVVIGCIMLLIAIYCFCVEQKRIRKERKWFKREMAALRKSGIGAPRVDDNDISRVSTIYSEGARPYCERLQTVFSGTSEIELTCPSRIGETSVSMTSVSVMHDPEQMAPPQSNPFRFWDEVEMRRHGMVTRQCVRPTAGENFDPNSI